MSEFLRGLDRAQAIYDAMEPPVEDMDICVNLECGDCAACQEAQLDADRDAYYENQAEERGTRY